MNNYKRFLAMITTSTVVMFGLMYLNSYALDHVFFSETRTYMALYMGGAMAVVMLLFMLGMYQDKGKNAAIFIGAIKTDWRQTDKCMNKKYFMHTIFEGKCKKQKGNAF